VGRPPSLNGGNYFLEKAAHLNARSTRLFRQWHFSGVCFRGPQNQISKNATWRLLLHGGHVLAEGRQVSVSAWVFSTYHPRLSHSMTAFQVASFLRSL
jgi:hypothetical protein